MLTACLELLSAFSGMEREKSTSRIGLALHEHRAQAGARDLCGAPVARSDRAPGRAGLALLECLLEVADSSMTYRTRYYTTLQPLAVLDVLMADEKNPRSLDFQLSHLLELYEKLPRTVPEDLKAMQEAIAELRGFDLSRMSYPLPGAELAKKDAAGPANLEGYLRGLERLLPTWSNNLSSTYFSHARVLPVTIGE
jgi:uncharacterized alpha-E superfamily protein